LTQELEQITSSSRGAGEENANLLAKLEMVTAERDQKESDIGHHQRINEEREKEVANLRDSLESLRQGTGQEHDDLRRQLEAVRAERDQFQEDIESHEIRSETTRFLLRTSKSEREEEIASHKATADDLRRQLAAVKTERDQFENENGRLRAEINSLNTVKHDKAWIKKSAVSIESSRGVHNQEGLLTRVSVSGMRRPTGYHDFQDVEIHDSNGDLEKPQVFAVDLTEGSDDNSGSMVEANLVDLTNDEETDAEVLPPIRETIRGDSAYQEARQWGL